MRQGSGLGNIKDQETFVGHSTNLGTKDTFLPTGVTFGERSFEAVNMQRLSSVLTGDGLTELLVVPRDAYLSLVAVLRNADEMARVSMLRRTNIFRQLDATHLRAFAQAMRLVSYRIGDNIYKAGWSHPTDYQGWGYMPGMTIIATGECSVEADIKLSNDLSVVALLNTDSGGSSSGNTSSNNNSKQSILLSTVSKKMTATKGISQLL